MDPLNPQSFTELDRRLQETKLLAKQATITKTLHPYTQFATIVFIHEIIGPWPKEKMDLSLPGVTSWSWEGIDEAKIQIGYLSHDGAHLRVQTKDKTIVDLPLGKINIEEHGLGLALRTSTGKNYVVGNFMAINEQLSPDKKMRYNFGSESTIWMRELGNLGAIDKAEWTNSRNKSKRFMIIWFAVITLISILIVAL